MPQQDSFRSNPQRKPGPPPSRSPQRLSPEDRLKLDLTFSISLQRLRESVEKGQKVCFTQDNGDVLAGYLTGMDREYFIIFQPDVNAEGKHYVRERGVSRGLNSDIEFTAENTFEDEVTHPQMVERVERFREWIVKSYSQGPAIPVKQSPRTTRPAHGDVPRSWAPQPGTQRPVQPAKPQFTDSRRG